MKVHYLFSVVLLIFLNSCNKAHQDTQKETQAIERQTEEQKELKAVFASDPRKIGPEKPDAQYKIENNIYKINASKNPLYGYWVGAFGKNKINIALAHTEGDSIYGHSVCAGNFRPIKGTFKSIGPGTYSINMFEPGDDQYDGEFKFTIDINKEKLSGLWKPYKNTVSSKDYILEKRQFKYDPRVGDFPDASSRYLDVPDVENFLPEEIEMIRNEIYARHGYSFTNLKIRRVFDQKDWYIPMSVDIRDQLTELEASNIDLLYNYEDYYEEYYNSYGR